MVSQSSGIVIFGVILIVVAVVIVGVFVVGLTRRTNRRSESGTVASERSIPRDPTMSNHPEDVQDTEGNFTRSATEDTNRNSRT